MSLARRDLEDSSKHIKILEKQMKTITQERDELHKVCNQCLMVTFQIENVGTATLNTACSDENTLLMVL